MASANRRLRYKFLKRGRISPKRTAGTPVFCGNILPERACSPSFCRTLAEQILENARCRVWPSSCNSRCVAALAVPPSTLPPLRPLSRPEASSRPTTDATRSTEGPPDNGAPFTEVLAGVVAATGADAGGGALRLGLDTPPGIEILRGGASPAQPGEEQPEPEPEPDSGQPAVGQTFSAVQMQAALAPVPPAWNLPMPGESVSLSGGQAPVGPETPAAVGMGLDLVAQGMGGGPSGREPQAQILKTPTLVLNPAGVDARPEGGPADGSTADLASPRPVPADSVLPPSTSQKADDLGPAQPNTPESLDVAAAATAAPAGVPARGERSPESTDHSAPRITTNAPASAQTSRKSSGSVVAQVLALSGLAPHTIDSIPPVDAAPQPAEIPADPCPPPERRATVQTAVLARAASQNLAESLVPAADMQVRVLATSTPDRDEIAFAVQMKAMPTSEEPPQRQSPVKLAADQASLRSPIPGADREVPAAELPAASQNRPSLSGEPDQAPARAGRERPLEAPAPERTETPAATPAGKLIPNAAPDAQVRTETASERPDAAAAKPVRLQDAMESAAKPEAARATPVRDMKFEVTGGERRVEVRLSERGGEVKMTVRTPDADLASTLRENLPALSARLAESGLKSEAWHPAASSPNERRYTAESSGGGASQDTNSQPRQQDREPQDGAGQRRPESPQEPILQKQKGSDFAWLMSSLR